MAEMKKELDSTTYRKLLEFIKKEGAETFISFFDDYTKVKEQSLIFKALCEGKHPLLSLVKKHRSTVGFIRELDDSYPCILLERNLPQLLNSITSENISQQIDTAMALEELRISSVTIGGLEDSRKSYQTLIKYHNGEIDGICKYYSNGELNYVLNRNAGWVDYNTYVRFGSDSGNFLLGVQNVITHEQERYINLTDFTFDANLLPSEVELARIEPPKSLTDSKVYVKK